jgi:AraC family transcriptional regulator
MSIERVSADCASGRTANDWVSAVQRSIETMRDDLGGEHSLRSLASSAWLSPFYFHRIFLKVTDSTPARFLSAWRMAEAKWMLAYSSASVTEICRRTGFSSLGTFSSQFTKRVGVSPRQFRRVVNAHRDRPVNDMLRDLRQSWAAEVAGPIAVTVNGGPSNVPAVVGLFRSSIPQESPTECGIVDVPGTAIFDGSSGGAQYILVMSFDESVSVVEAAAATDLDRCYVGAAELTSGIAARQATNATLDVQLRRRRLTDPPIVLTLPLLIAAVELETVGQTTRQSSRTRLRS